jgi:energy-coupling factor transporter transmembrane protein EcfT
MPLVFYGTVFAIVVFILINIVFLIIFLVFIRRDFGYLEHRKDFCCAPIAIVSIGSLLGFHVGNFYYSRFFGSKVYDIPFAEKAKFHTLLNILSIIFIVLVLLPIIFIDIYGLLKYKWGS